MDAHIWWRLEAVFEDFPFILACLAHPGVDEATKLGVCHRLYREPPCNLDEDCSLKVPWVVITYTISQLARLSFSIQGPPLGPWGVRGLACLGLACRTAGEPSKIQTDDAGTKQKTEEAKIKHNSNG